MRHAPLVRHFTFPSDGELLACAQAVPAVKAAPAAPATLTPTTLPPHAVLVLHGAGNGDKQSPTVLATAFAARGHHALAFDFSGHGESTGTLGRSSLRRRFEQARAVVDACLPARAPLVLVGFSMSGQTVADLAAHYGPRVAAVGLCAPAVYAARAWPVAFGDGFTGIIRTPDSWRNSPALDVFRRLPAGVRAVLVTPAVDAVIPPAVTEAVAGALDASRAAYVRMVLPAADHRLSLWFAAEARSREEFVDVLLNGRPKSGPAHSMAPWDRP
ncbi:alpha/beta fold hydrolase [Streptomyces sp. NPDC088745]|uniref:alpha/beta fold hydrolase n=1 Tax=Streptomyces sp. NPDC088745 TaxID=3365884 RepID=UPI003825D9F0